MKEKALCNFDLVGGRVVDPYSGMDRVKDLFVRDGIIYSSIPEGKPAEQTFNIKDHIILPGLLDLRVHNRVPGDAQSETFNHLQKQPQKEGFLRSWPCQILPPIQITQVQFVIFRTE